MTEESRARYQLSAWPVLQADGEIKEAEFQLVRKSGAVLDVLRGFAMLGVLLGNLFVLYSLRFAHWKPPTTIRGDGPAALRSYVKGPPTTAMFRFGPQVARWRLQSPLKQYLQTYRRLWARREPKPNRSPGVMKSILNSAPLWIAQPILSLG